MKRKIAILLAGIACVSVLGGCNSKLEVDTNTVKIEKKGKVIQACVEDFSESYYSEEELNAYVQEAVESYTSEAGEKSVAIEESKVLEGKAYLTLKFDSVENFAAFNDEECFVGTVLQARNAGYDFNLDFYDVSNKSEDAGSSAGESPYVIVSGREVMASDELNVLILKDNVDIIVPGTVCYVSTDKTSVSGKNTVSVEPKENDTDESVLVYVLYK